jgi:calcineurin-like phosphoesterase family protein
MNYYFSADFHLNHVNIIKYDNRPFDTVEQMNATIISNYNSIVTAEDEFYFLGDFCMGDRSKAEAYLQQLNGKKFFIRGNHDQPKLIELFKKSGTYLGSRADLIINGRPITLSHYCLDSWKDSQNGSWLLHGHYHGNLPDNPNRLSIDVGINIWNYKPVSFAEIERKMHTRINTMQDSLRGKVININDFGNAIVNVTKTQFNQFTDGRKYTILANVGSVEKICVDYDEVEKGDFLALFNSNGFLELAINKGRADQLLGLCIGSLVLIQIEHRIKEGVFVSV